MDWFSALTGKRPLFTRRNLTFLGGRYIYFDVSKTEQELGYQVTPLDETVEECVRWFTEDRERVLAGEVVHPVVAKSQPADPAAMSLHAE